MSTNKSKSEISDNTIDGTFSHANVIKDNGKIESQQNNNTVSDKENNNQIIQGDGNNIYQINESPSQENISVEIKVSKVYQANNLLDSSVDKSEKIENLKEETDIEFIITGSIKNTRHKRKVKAIEKLLQELGCDPTLVIDDVDEGSLKFVLKGSPEGLERIERLFNSGELTEIFDVPIENVEFIEPEKEKLEFTIAGDISYTDVAKLKAAVTGVDQKELLIQKIRTYQGYKKLNLSEANLSEANLIEANLSEANLSGANLSGASLSRTYLIEANLIEANLSEANLIEANLIKANLSGANLIKANFIGVYLIGANLIEANLIEANLSGANLIEANLIEANLSGANLIGADLIGADLRGASLRRANLRGASLSGADFRGASLNGADFREANLRRAILSEANLSGAELEKSKVINTKFSSNSQGMNEQLKQDLIQQGAIFEDSLEDPVLTPIGR
ncbi:pentapeptide repeat-containing protein [Okeania sp. SIO1I7]|uniref:pentapeptide repeat-containing protein n=1 Tax=Okeania sp. SIO1I7 TaxID=2607772 RepID=UPI0013FCC068|nr:pentapeptide repeat-containing protein [Okeania sp. SIO1I7]NET25821.1 pentapeptide repeat-containing protein [Okeania sp. SIO1I7]